MKIAIIGASNGVGLACVETALARGHQVRALSRNTSPYPQHEHLTVVQGDARKAADVQALISGVDAVLVTLGTGKSMAPTTLYTEAGTALLAAYQQAGSKAPVLVLTGFGAGESGQYQPWYVRPLFNYFLGAVYRNKTALEDMLRNSPLPWEFVRPGVLTNGAATQRYRVLTEYARGMKVGFIARRDVADYMVREAEAPKHLGLCPALSN